MAQSANQAPPTFTRLANFRDVARTINSQTKTHLLNENLLFRSARPDEATAADKEILTTRYGIQTIIDFRTKSEHIKQDEKRKKTLALTSPTPNNSRDIEDYRIPGMEYVNINLNGRGFERALVMKLSWLSLGRMLCLLARGYRIEGISILVREVMVPKGLLGLGLDTCNYCGPEIAQTLTLITSNLTTEPPRSTLIHCTQGKDRTGLISALILLLLDIPIAAIMYDYQTSVTELAAEYEERLAEMKEMGFTDEFAGCPADWIPSLKEYLDGKGGVETWLSDIGFGKTLQDKLKWALHAKSVEDGTSSR